MPQQDVAAKLEQLNQYFSHATTEQFTTSDVEYFSSLSIEHEGYVTDPEQNPSFQATYILLQKHPFVSQCNQLLEQLKHGDQNEKFNNYFNLLISLLMLNTNRYSPHLAPELINFIIKHQDKIPEIQRQYLVEYLANFLLICRFPAEPDNCDFVYNIRLAAEGFNNLDNPNHLNFFEPIRQKNDRLCNYVTLFYSDALALTRDLINKSLFEIIKEVIDQLFDDPTNNKNRVLMLFNYMSSLHLKKTLLSSSLTLEECNQLLEIICNPAKSIKTTALIELTVAICINIIQLNPENNASPFGQLQERLLNIFIQYTLAVMQNPWSHPTISLTGKLGFLYVLTQLGYQPQSVSTLHSLHVIHILCSEINVRTAQTPFPLTVFLGTTNKKQVEETILTLFEQCFSRLEQDCAEQNLPWDLLSILPQALEEDTFFKLRTAHFQPQFHKMIAGDSFSSILCLYILPNLPPINGKDEWLTFTNSSPNITIPQHLWQVVMFLSRTTNLNWSSFTTPALTQFLNLFNKVDRQYLKSIYLDFLKVITQLKNILSQREPDNHLDTRSITGHLDGITSDLDADSLKIIITNSPGIKNNNAILYLGTPEMQKVLLQHCINLMVGYFAQLNECSEPTEELKTKFKNCFLLWLEITICITRSANKDTLLQDYPPLNHYPQCVFMFLQIHSLFSPAELQLLSYKDIIGLLMDHSPQPATKKETLADTIHAYFKAYGSTFRPLVLDKSLLYQSDNLVAIAIYQSALWAVTPADKLASLITGHLTSSAESKYKPIYIKFAIQLFIRYCVNTNSLTEKDTSSICDHLSRLEKTSCFKEVSSLFAALIQSFTEDNTPKNSSHLQAFISLIQHFLTPLYREQRTPSTEESAAIISLLEAACTNNNAGLELNNLEPNAPPRILKTLIYCLNQVKEQLAPEIFEQNAFVIVLTGLNNPDWIETYNQTSDSLIAAIISLITPAIKTKLQEHLIAFDWLFSNTAPTTEELAIGDRLFWSYPVKLWQEVSYSFSQAHVNHLMRSNDALGRVVACFWMDITASNYDPCLKEQVLKDFNNAFAAPAAQPIIMRGDQIDTEMTKKFIEWIAQNFQNPKDLDWQTLTYLHNTRESYNEALKFNPSIELAITQRDASWMESSSKKQEQQPKSHKKKKNKPDNTNQAQQFVNNLIASLKEPNKNTPLTALRVQYTHLSVDRKMLSAQIYEQLNPLPLEHKRLITILESLLLLDPAMSDLVHRLCTEQVPFTLPLIQIMLSSVHLMGKPILKEMIWEKLVGLLQSEVTTAEDKQSILAILERAEWQSFVSANEQIQGIMAAQKQQSTNVATKKKSKKPDQQQSEQSVAPQQQEQSVASQQQEQSVASQQQEQSVAPQQQEQSVASQQQEQSVASQQQEQSVASQQQEQSVASQQQEQSVAPQQQEQSVAPQQQEQSVAPQQQEQSVAPQQQEQSVASQQQEQSVASQQQEQSVASQQQEQSVAPQQQEQSVAPQQQEQSVQQRLRHPIPQRPGHPIPQRPGHPIPQRPGQPVPQRPAQPVPQRPAQPVPQRPAQPVPQRPAQPVPQRPAQPVPQRPAQPVPQRPAQPVPQRPAQPVLQQPGQPAKQRPAQPAQLPGHYFVQQPAQPAQLPRQYFVQQPVQPTQLPGQYFVQQPAQPTQLPGQYFVQQPAQPTQLPGQYFVQQPAQPTQLPGQYFVQQPAQPTQLPGQYFVQQPAQPTQLPGQYFVQQQSAQPPVSRQSPTISPPLGAHAQSQPMLTTARPSQSGVFAHTQPSALQRTAASAQEEVFTYSARVCIEGRMLKITLSDNSQLHHALSEEQFSVLADVVNDHPTAFYIKDKRKNLVDANLHRVEGVLYLPKHKTAFKAFNEIFTACYQQISLATQARGPQK